MKELKKKYQNNLEKEKLIGENYKHQIKKEKKQENKKM